MLALAFAGLGWFFLCALPTLGGFCLSLPLAGDAAKQLDNIADAIKLANKIPTSPFSAKIDNCAEHLTMKDLIGATRELKGEVVKRKASGVPWDHVDEVRNAQGFLLNQIAAINRKLAHPGTDAAMRNLLVADLGAPAECWTSPSSSSPEPSEWSMILTSGFHDDCSISLLAGCFHCL
ncbi:polymorphic toxin type 28 domain-containing protein [Streptomyces sp. NPDC057557]|uniref:polymorphic toxin type 28 domain-containing protein n=1 Tax=Streptomyces sp. NPDC057557 TaxID=3346167 RepID=UPI00368ACE05